VRALLPLAALIGCGPTAPEVVGLRAVQDPAPVETGAPDTEDTHETADTQETGDTEDTEPVAADAPALVLNEVASRNDSVIMTPSGAFADWFELYNAGDAPLDLTRASVTDGEATWRGAGELAPGAYLLIWADGEEGADHAPFNLSKDGDTLELAWDDVVFSTAELPALVGDTSLALFPDGGAPAITAWPTPGWTNGTHPTASTDPSDVLFQTDVIWDAYLEIPASSWESLEREPYTEVPASFSFLGAHFPLVNVRRKGVYGSLRSMDQKVALKVDLDDYADHNLRGVDDLTFNNMVQDESYVTELLTYELYRAGGLPAPRVGYVRLHVNGEMIGLYAWLESPDEDFLARWYADPTGPLFEGAYGVDFYTWNVGDFEYDEGPEPEDRSDLTELSAFLDGNPAPAAAYTELRTLVDMDQFLAYRALESLTWHWDGYTTANNYRVYHDPISDQFTMIPWGTDQTWTDEWYTPYAGGGRLFTWCLANTTCLADYNTALLNAADLLDATPLEEQMDRVLAFLEDDIAADPRREFDLSTHRAVVEDVRGNLRGGANRLRNAVP
jgi:hypothetical protein